MSRRLLIVAGVIGILVAAGLGLLLFSGGNAADSTSRSESSGSSGPWFQALKYLPDQEDDYLFVDVFDYARLRAAVLPSGPQFDDVRFYLDPFHTSGTVGDTLASPHDTAVKVQIDNGKSVVFAGRFGSAADRRSLETLAGTMGANAKPTLKEKAYGGRQLISLASVTGRRAERIQVSDSIVLGAVPSLEDGDPSFRITEMVDVLNKDQLSLADDPDFRNLIAGTDKLGLFEAIISNGPFSLSAPDVEDLLRGEYGSAAVDATMHQELLKAYLSFAAGWSVDSKGVFLGLVIYNRDAQTATLNASRLQQRVNEGVGFRSKRPWSERITSTDIQADGRLTLAKLYTNSFRLWKLIVDDLDNLWVTP